MEGVKGSRPAPDPFYLCAAGLLFPKGPSHLGYLRSYTGLLLMKGQKIVPLFIL